MAYFGTQTDAGPVVAMDHGTLGHVVMCECLTIGAAMREADRLNREHAAHQARAQRVAQDFYGKPRSRIVRQLVNEDGPEDFHG
jgi:hypothetical protein